MATPAPSLPHVSPSEGREEAQAERNDTIRAGASVSGCDPEKQKKMKKNTLVRKCQNEIENKCRSAEDTPPDLIGQRRVQQH